MDHRNYYGWMSNCNQKERVRNSHNTLTACTTPSVHVFSIFSTQFKPLIFHNTLTAYWLFQMHITRSKTYKCFASTHNNRADFTASISCLTHSHKCQQGKLSHYRLYTLSESTSLISIKCSHDTRFLVLSSLSLESLCSSLARYQAQQKVLAFSQALLTYRIPHNHIYKGANLLPPESLKISWSYSPKLSLLPKSNLLIFSPNNYLSIPHTSLTTITHILSCCPKNPPTPRRLFRASKLLTRLPLASSWSLPKILPFRSIQLPLSTAIACSSSSIRLHPSS